MKEYLESADEVLSNLHTHEKDGLSSAQASKLLDEYGLNKLDEAQKDSIVKRFFAQMADPMVIMLIIAAVISLIVGILSLIHI